MKSHRDSLYVRAFTLVELSISIAIIMLLTVILMSRYPETSIRLNLANSTHTLSLLIREAQVRGSAIDSADSSIGGYGVYVTRNDTTKAVLFGDTVDPNGAKPYGVAIGNGLFEGGSPVNETKTTAKFPSRYVIRKLCVGTGFPFTCNDAGSPQINALTISFTRPNPAPNIYINNNIATTATAACIELNSPKAPLTGHVRSVQVFSSGMIRTGIGKCDNN